MNRAEYMKELAYLLQDMPDEEREEALQYYEDYFDDAGPEKEADVIRELGSPEKLAAIIREGVRNGYADSGAEYTERGYHNEYYQEPGYSVSTPEREPSREAAGKVPRRRNPLLWVLIICSSIFWIPLLAGAAAVLFAALLTVVCGVGGIVLAVMIIAVVCIVAGIIFIGFGVGRIFTVSLAGMMFTGVGLIFLAAGILALWLSVWICGRAVPCLIHLLGRCIHGIGHLFLKGGVRA